jgi:hypothetical protein
LTTIKSHLKPEGISIFDLWYGPTVLTNPPSVRIKRLENDSIQVTRIAEPVIYPNDNCVDVNYHIFIKDKNTEAIKELKEIHKKYLNFLLILKYYNQIFFIIQYFHFQFSQRHILYHFYNLLSFFKLIFY